MRGAPGRCWLFPITEPIPPKKKHIRPTIEPGDKWREMMARINRKCRGNYDKSGLRQQGLMAWHAVHRGVQAEPLAHRHHRPPKQIHIATGIVAAEAGVAQTEA